MPNDALAIVGRTLAEKYAVESLVNEGHFASVYSARNLVWDLPVAIRAVTVLGELPPADRQKLYHRMVQDGALLTELSDCAPSICRTRDVGTLVAPNGEWIPYVVTEWLEGRTLEDELLDATDRGEPALTLARAVTLLHPIAAGLSLAHDAGLVHHNINPANVLLARARATADNAVSVYLLDLGVGRIVEQAQKLHAQTKAGVSLVIPAYAAPEQLAGGEGEIGSWSDVFALAVLVLHTAGARRLATGVADASPTPRTLGLEVSDAVEHVFERALARAPHDRFRTAGDFWWALNAALDLPISERPHFNALRGAPREAGDLRSTRSSAPPSAMSDHPRLSLSSLHPSIPPGAVTAAPHSGSPSSRGRAFALGAVAAMAVVSAAGVVVIKRAPAAASHEGPAAAVTIQAAQTPPKPTCPEGMIEIPGGHFFMGSDEDLESERPAHNVSLSAFCMDRHEVTTEQFKSCSDDGRCKRAAITNEWEGITAKDQKVYDPLCNVNDAEHKATHPINCVNWDMADVYCKAEGGRLPTEAEWEFAARGPDGRKYPWGDDEPSASLLNACGAECVAWAKKNHVSAETMFVGDDGWANTAPVGSFPKGASRYGVEDVVGNVWEWVSDWHAPYDAEARTDPRGPAEGDKRVVRGGAWNGAYASWVRPTFRFSMTPDARSYGIGFRCARSL